MIVIVIIIGSALLWISYLPFELVKIKIDAFALHGSAEKFTFSLFKQITVKLRFIGIAVILASGLLYAGRRQVHQYVSDMLTSSGSFIREIKEQFKEAVKKEDRIHLFSFFIILLIAISVRLFFISQPVRNDEAATFIAFAEMPLFIGLSNYSLSNNHLFHTFLVHMAYLFLGNKPWVIRLPALFAGILLVPASYVTVRIFFNKYAALLTAGIIASSTVLVSYSANARGYTLLCLIFLLILSLAVYLKQSRNAAAWLLFAVLSAFGFYTIPIMIYPFGIVVTWLFLSIVFKDTNLCRNSLLKNLFVSIIITALLTFLLYAPVLAVSGLKLVVAHKWAVQKSWLFFMEKLPTTFSSIWIYWNAGIPSVIKLIMVAGFFISVVFYRSISNYRIPLILAVFLWSIPLLTVHRVVEFARMWLFLLPVYIGLASAGICYLLKPAESRIKNFRSVIFPVFAVLLSAWLAFNVVQLNAIYYADDPECKGEIRDNEQIAFFLKNYLRPGDRVLDPAYKDPSLIYYFSVYDIPVKYFIDEQNIKGRILAIVNEQEQTMEDYLAGEGLSGDNYSIPKLLKRYRLASLYEIKRKE